MFHLKPDSSPSSAIHYTQTYITQLSKTCPELGKIPPGWAFDVLPNTKYIVWIEIATGKSTFTHPHFGPLPTPWVIAVSKDIKNQEFAAYYNPQTKQWSQNDPRLGDKQLWKQAVGVGRGMRLAAANMRVGGGDLRNLVRQPIGSRDIRGEYEILHVIDGAERPIGGMNGGVFVVKKKGVKDKLYVEKRYMFTDPFLIQSARVEIVASYNMKHPALSMYSAAFMNATAASLYLEFCDRGSLTDLIVRFRRRGKMVPEPFIWHCYLGLLDALVYMHTGGPGAQNWIPLLHRDIKTDNILIKSRSTPNSQSYPYVVLTDFGLVVEDRHPTDPLCDQKHKYSKQVGTPVWNAPELLWDPWPQTQMQVDSFPEGGRHTIKSDVWALGTAIWTLCAAMEAGHVEYFQRDPKCPDKFWLYGLACRKHNLKVPACYSLQLAQAVEMAMNWDVARRPGSVEMLAMADRLCQEAGFKDGKCAIQWPLPEWSCPVHDYLKKRRR